MTEVDVADDRLRILLAQLDGAWEMLDARLTGRHPLREDSGEPAESLTDAEYLWEPAPGCEMAECSMRVWRESSSNQAAA